MSRRRTKGRSQGGREWVGGYLSAPFFVTDRDEPYRPGLVVWMDVRDDLVVAMRWWAREHGCAVGDALVAAMERPLAARRVGRTGSG